MSHKGHDIYRETLIELYRETKADLDDVTQKLKEINIDPQDLEDE